MLLERAPTPCDEKIYSAEWRAWRDPDIPDFIDPVDALIGRHLGTPTESKIAIIADGEAISYRELANRIERASGALAGLGLGPESRMLMFGTDSLDYVSVWLGAVRTGAVPVVVSDLYKQRELLYFINDTGARMLFIDAEQLPKLNEIAAELPESLKTIVVRGETGGLARFSHQSAITLSAALAARAPAGEAYRRHSNDIAYMFYSGGTTGTAKGITHLAYDFLVVPARHGAMWEYAARDVVYATSKKYFTHGIWPGLLIPLAFGATLVLDRRPPTADVVLANLRKHKVSKFVTVPTVLKNLIELVKKGGEPANCPHLEFAVSASEKMPPEIFEEFHRLFGVELHDSIGSSEIAYEWIVNTPKVFRRGSLGKPVYGCEVRLIAPDGKDVTQPNVPGECWIKSKTACFYYWRKYEKSRETFIGDWTRTGDNLTFDEDGFFWFSGRNNDLFKVKGLWVSPIEIEAALTSHAAVREAAVVAFDDADGLTKPRAFIALRDGFGQSPALLDELRKAVAPLGSYKIPEDFVVIDALPRTTLQKIDRRALRERQRPQL
jgi:benzoate-CoA ligase